MLTVLKMSSYFVAIALGADRARRYLTPDPRPLAT